jgi:hypothetical protein
LGAIIPEAARPLIDQIAAGTRLALASSDAGKAREQATQELTPLIRLPAAQWGVNVGIGKIRMFNVPTFTGAETDILDVVRWLSRVLSLAEAHTLTFQAAINLMIQGSGGGAADYLEQMKDEGKTQNKIVQLMETRYSDLCTPEEARVKANNLSRKEGEELPCFIDPLRSMAKMPAGILLTMMLKYKLWKYL